MNFIMNFIILTAAIVTLLYDADLAIRGELTISQRCQAYFPPVIDWCIGIGGLVFLCLLKRWWPEFDFSLGVFLGGFWLHIWAANKERYRR